MASKTFNMAKAAQKVENSALRDFIEVSIDQLINKEPILEDETVYQPMMPLNPTYKCEICGFKTKKKKQFKNHTETCKTNEPVELELTIKTETIDDESDSSKKERQCQRCELVLPSVMAMKLHMIKEHANEDYEMINCPACSFSCFLVESLERHFLVHTPEKLCIGPDWVPEGPPEVFKCDQCTWTNEVEAKMENHKKKCHPIIESCKYGCVDKRGTEKQMAKHYDKEHSFKANVFRKTFSCEEPGCKFNGRSNEGLLEHMYKHTGVKPFECDLCGEKYESKSKMGTHIARKHTKIGRYVCHRCGWKFIDATTFKRHVMAHEQIKPFACDRCDFRSVSKFNLKTHIIRHAKRDALGIKDDEVRGGKFCTNLYKRANRCFIRIRKSEPAKHFPEDFKCDLCEFATTHLRLLLAHITIKHKFAEKNLECRDCPFRTHKKLYLDRHIKYMHSPVELLSCPECDFKTKYQDSLVKHSNVHAEDKLVFKCHLCDFSTTCSKNFKYHKLNHAGVKPHACPDCPYRSVNLNRLRQHRMIHTGLKPYPCKLCPFRCADKTTLIRHAYTHGKPKPHACDSCSFRTVFPGLLAKHKRTHLDKKDLPVLLVVEPMNEEDEQQSEFDLNKLLE